MSIVQLIDYDVGNMKSLANALAMAGFQSVCRRRAEDIDPDSPIILPGVGSFAYCKQRLVDFGLFEPLRDMLHNNDPVCFVGICVGMQLLFQDSVEDGLNTGFGYFEGSIHSLREQTARLSEHPPRLPNTHWQNITGTNRPGPYYFTHSFGNIASRDCSAHYELGGLKITAIASRGTVTGFQFHPEKSAEQGLTLLRETLTASRTKD